MRRLPLVPTAALVLLFVSCSSSPPGAPPAKPRRVLLLSLDGASAEALHKLYRDGSLSAGGFARFFKEGQVADRLIPVNPTLTAVNHISLATGYVAGATGIVANRYHPAGAPFLDMVSGFEAPIGTETLWEAARRQGKRVGVTTWPGADNKGERRSADWGMIYVNDPDREADLEVLARGDWRELGGPVPESFSPAQVARVQVGGKALQDFELIAVDRTDDGRTGYDRLIARTSRGQGELATGVWSRVPCPDPQPGREAETAPCWVKLLRLDPGLAAVQVYFNGVYANRAYPESLLVEIERTGVRWPGAPDDGRLSDTWNGKPGIDLETWLEQSDRFTEYFGDTLRLAAARPGWDLLMGYMPVIDEAGHQLLLEDPRQADFSAERREEFARARLHVWQTVDRELARLLDALDLRSTAVVIVSDHGMRPVHTILDPNVLLRDWGLLTADEKGGVAASSRAYAASNGGISHVYIRPDLPAQEREQIAADLRERFAGWKSGTEKPIAQFVPHAELGRVGLDHPNSGDLVLFAVPGWAFGGGGLREGRAVMSSPVHGMHGYLNEDPAMHGIYLAVGAGISQGNAGTVPNPDVAGRIAAWLGIEKPRQAVTPP